MLLYFGNMVSRCIQTTTQEHYKYNPPLKDLVVIYFLI